MTNKQKLAILLGKMAAAPVLFLLMLFAGSTTAYAAEYELYIGSTQVTDANKGDILGDGTASYDPDTATLYLNGVSIGEGNSHYDDEYGDGYEYSLYSGTDAVKHLVITGNNRFASTDNGMLFKVTGPTSYDNVFAKHSLMITGNGTLTSTVAGDGYKAAAMTVVGETDQNGGTGKGGVFMGNTDGTGPRLELTGVRRGAYFYDTGRVTMQGGTMIAKATGTPGTGVTLPPISNIGGETYFEGGTIAGFGTTGTDEEENEYGGAFEGSGHVDTSQLGMQRVYPEPEEGATNYSDESGWCVVGMTQGDHVADTQAVLSELGLIVANKEVNTVKPDDANKADDPNKLTGIDPTAEDDTTTTDTNETYVDTDIDVWGFAQNTLYSVDVEWGAMTFEYVAEWDAETYTMGEGSWKVYSTSSSSSIESTQDAINKVTITNHSNAPIYAKLSYKAESAYSTTTGTFTKPAEDAGNINATWTETDTTNRSTGYYELQSSANSDGTAGTAAVGNVYFMPTGISDADKTSGIAKWTKIGKITVGISTTQP